jgi:hypothetical protein
MVSELLHDSLGHMSSGLRYQATHCLYPHTKLNNAGRKSESSHQLRDCLNVSISKIQSSPYKF